MNYRYEIDTAVVAEKQKGADLNGRRELFQSTVFIAAEQKLGHKTRQEV